MLTKPKTLLNLAGAPDRICRLENAALLLIDFQNEYLTGNLPLSGAAQAVAEARKLLDRARGASIPVIHVVQHGRPGGALFDPDTSASNIIPELSATTGEIQISKSLPNAFANTTLEVALRDTGCSELIVAGFMTHMCVSSTVRAALDLGFQSTVVASATATRDLPDPVDGKTVYAEVLQTASLAALNDRFANIVARVDELLEPTVEIVA